MHRTGPNRNNMGTVALNRRGWTPRLLGLPALCLAVAFAAGCGSEEATPLGPVVRFVHPGGLAEFVSIQACMDISSAGDVCLALPGVYPENIRFNGKRMVLASTHGPDFTVLDGTSAGPVVQFVDYETRNTVLAGFTITNGRAAIPEPTDPEAAAARLAAGQAGEEHGGGIRIGTASPLIQNCIVRDNAAEGNGGGVYCAFTASQPLFQDVVLYNNTAGGSGGGLFVFSGTVELDTCLVIENTAADGGGIAAGFGAHVTLNHSTLADNAATTGTSAAALRLFNSSAAWTDSIVGDKIRGPAPALPLVVLGLDRTQPSPGIPPELSLTLDHVNLQGGVADIRYEGDCLTEPDLCQPQVWEEVLGDPLFVAWTDDEDNPLQGYYLSQIDGGQSLDSPCLNAGSTTAEQAGLDSRTTQNGMLGRQLPDSGTVDLGYHYPIRLP